MTGLPRPREEALGRSSSLGDQSRPAQMLGDPAPYQSRVRIASEYVECGGLPPLFSGEACLARSEEYLHAQAEPRQVPVFADGTILQHVPASRDGAQRRQAAALQIRGAGSRSSHAQLHVSLVGARSFRALANSLRAVRRSRQIKYHSGRCLWECIRPPVSLATRR
jgi:hypothetical protein